MKCPDCNYTLTEKSCTPLKTDGVPIPLRIFFAVGTLGMTEFLKTDTYFKCRKCGYEKL